MAKWQLKSIEISGGFLLGLALQFPPGLTCIIGPRGSGKSTLAEIIRFCMNGPTGSPKASAELIKNNLGSALVTIHTSPDERGVAYIVRRGFRQAATLTTADGVSVTAIDLDRGTFLPLDAYSSAEIEDIANENLGDKRRTLLDELRDHELRSIHDRIAAHRRELEANADQIRACRRLIADLSEQIEEIGDAEGKLQAMPEPAADDTGASLVAATRQQALNKGEMGQVGRIRRGLSDYVEALRTATLDVKNCLGIGLVSEGSMNEPVLQALAQRLWGLLGDVDEGIERIILSLEEAGRDVSKAMTELERVDSVHESGYSLLREQNLAASDVIRERAEAEQAAARLAGLRDQRGGAVDEVRDLLSRRRVLKREYLLERESVSRLRSDVAAELQAEAGDKVRLRILSNADTLGYRQALLDGLRGSSLRSHDDIVDKLICIRPEHLSQIISDNDAGELESQSTLGRERCGKILAAFREKVDPFALETVEIDDRVCIELDTSSDDEPNFKDAADLSRGQKCTAMLPLLLARRDTPLVIDQPEDNLDNRFIYETVVETVRRVKLHRQLVFITHNANIPVLGGADMVVVMGSDGRKGFTERVGTLDECREHIIDLLEGGRDAFELRRRRYESS